MNERDIGTRRFSCDAKTAPICHAEIKRNSKYLARDKETIRLSFSSVDAGEEREMSRRKKCANCPRSDLINDRLDFSLAPGTDGGRVGGLGAGFDTKDRLFYDGSRLESAELQWIRQERMNRETRPRRKVNTDAARSRTADATFHSSRFSITRFYAVH